MIKDKIFIVTGAGSGIGKALTLALLEKGAKIIAVDIRQEELDNLKQEIGDKSKFIETHKLDIFDKKAVENFPKNISKDFNKIYGLVNNAGIIQPFVKINDLDYESIDKTMNVNFYGTLYMTKTFLPILLSQPEAHIVNISSMGGFLPVPGQSIYGASKAAVKLFTEGLYAELIDTSVKVTVVFPGAINTNIAKNSGIKMQSKSDKQNYQTLPAKEAAKIIIDGIEKNKTQIFVGNDSKMMNFLYRLNPIYAINLIAKQMKSLLDK